MTVSLPIYINLAYEDELSRTVLQRLLRSYDDRYEVGVCYGQGGFGYLRRQISGFNNAARGVPFLLLTDLDRNNCPPSLVNEWLPRGVHPNLLFRVAVREVEAWLLADRSGIARLLGIQIDTVPHNPESLPDPKAALVGLARRSRHGGVRRDIVPPDRSTAQQGPNYNGRLGEFVAHVWNPTAASANSPSLKRTLRALEEFRCFGI